MNPIILTTIYFIVTALVIGLIDTPLVAAGAAAFLALVLVHTKTNEKQAFAEEEKPDGTRVGGGG